MLGRPAAMGSQVTPASRLTSRLTTAGEPRLEFHLICCTEPAAHFTAVFGAVMVMEPLPDTMVKLASEVSEPVLPALSVAVTRMRPFVVAGPGAVHTQVRAAPASAVQPGTAVKLAPPLVEYCTSNLVID